MQPPKIAEQLYELKYYKLALQELEDVIAQDSEFTPAYFLMGIKLN